MDVLKTLVKSHYEKVALGAGLAMFLLVLIGRFVGGPGREDMARLEKQIARVEKVLQNSIPPDDPLEGSIATALQTSEGIRQGDGAHPAIANFPRWMAEFRPSGASVAIPDVKVGQEFQVDDPKLRVDELQNVTVLQGQDIVQAWIGPDKRSLFVKGLKVSMTEYRLQVQRPHNVYLAYTGRIIEAIDIGAPRQVHANAEIGSITISWTEGEGNVPSTGYDVLRRRASEKPFTDDDTQHVINRVRVTATSYLDNKIEPRTEYVYAVRAWGEVEVTEADVAWRDAAGRQPRFGVAAARPKASAGEDDEKDVQPETREVKSPLSEECRVKSLTDTRLFYTSVIGGKHRIVIKQFDRTREDWIYVSGAFKVGEAIRIGARLKDKDGKYISSRKIMVETDYLLMDAYEKKVPISAGQRRILKVDPDTGMPLHDASGNPIYELQETIQMLKKPVVVVQDKITGKQEELVQTRSID